MASTKNLYEKMNKNNFQVSNYTYPDNLGSEEFIHAIQIAIYRRTDGTGYSGNNSRNISGGGGGQAKAFRTNNPLYNTKKSLMGSTNRLSETISLYMPKDLSASYDIAYNNTDITQSLNYASAFNSSVPSVKEMWSNNAIDVIGNKIENLLPEGKTMSEKLKSGVEAVKDFGKAAAYNVESLSTALSLYTKVAKNPHMEYVFEKVSNRTFTFNFVFTPKNQQETRNIDNIIRLLKTTAIPRLNEMSGKLGAYYDYPCVYDITFISNGKENQWLHKISTCLLTNIKTDPTTEAGFRAFEDLDGKGTPPAKITLDLTFEEMEVMTQQRMEEGF